MANNNDEVAVIYNSEESDSRISGDKNNKTQRTG